MASRRQKKPKIDASQKAVNTVSIVTDGDARAMHGARLSFPEPRKKSLARSSSGRRLGIFPRKKKNGGFDMNIFDEVNLLPEELLAQRLGLASARDGKSFLCPDCGNGSGKTGDGIKQTKLKGKLVWHCYRCGGHWSNVDLVALVEGISPSDTAELAKRLEELFPESNKPFLFSRGKGFSHFSTDRAGQASRSASGAFGYRSDGVSLASSDSLFQTPWTVSPNLASESVRAVEPVPPSEQKKLAFESEPKNYGKTFYPRYVETARKFLTERGGSYRGLTSETFEKYGIVVHPEFVVGDTEKVPTLIIPYDDYHFVARAIDSKRRPTQHGQGAGLYEPLAIDEKFPTFIVEGELDALSVVQSVGNLGIRCVATGGASKYGKVVPLLEKRFRDLESKPSFLVMFDNDAAGKTNGLKLIEELRRAGYPAEMFFLSEHMTEEKYPKVDANDLLQSNPDELVRRLLNGLEKSYESLLRQKAVNEERRQKLAETKVQATGNKSGIEIFSFTDYFSGEFFRDIEMTAKYSARKTGFENIDASQVFMPGVYALGALPASGKTTFAWQLLNQLAEKGEPCIYCSFEMSKAELFTKSVVRELYKKNPAMSERLNLTSANIRRGAMRNSRELVEQAAQFAQSATNLKVAELSNTSVTELIEGLKPLCADVDRSPVICLDYLQIIPSKGSKASSPKEKIDEVMLRLKDFQRATSTTLLVISAFNRENYYQNVSFSSFKESGAIEYSADVIWGLENHGIDAEGKLDKDEVIKMSREKVRRIKFSCLKNRNGGQYECFFRYHAAYDYFESLQEENKGSRYEH
jgi:replicative DNA helicase